MTEKPKISGKVKWLTIALGVCLATLILLTGLSHALYEKEKVGRRFTQALKQKTDFAENELKFLSSFTAARPPEKWMEEYPPQRRANCAKKEISLYVFDNDRLYFWTDQSTPIPHFYVYNYFSNRIINPGNGLFYSVLHKDENRKFLALIKIKDDFPVSNRYLPNEFLPDFKLPANTRTVKNSEADLILKDPEGQPLLYVKIQKTPPDWYERIITLLLLLTAGLFFFWLHQFLSWFISSGKGWIFFLTSAGVSAVALFLISENISFIIPYLPMFGPELYAGKIFSSLGSYNLFTFWMLYAAAGFFRLSYRRKIFFLKGSAVPALVVTITAFGMLYAMMLLVRDLVLNSQSFPFPENLPDVNFYWASLGLCLLMNIISVRLILKGIASPFERNFSTAQIVSGAIICILLLLAERFTEFYPSLLITVFCFSYVALIPKNLRNAFHYILIGGATGHFFSLAPARPLKIKKDSEAELIASKLTSENDPLTEYLFEAVKERILDDKDFRTGIFTPGKLNPEFTELFIKKYFNGYWLKYAISAGIFDSRTRARLNAGNSGVNDFEYYNEIIEGLGKATATDKLYFVRKPSGKIAYIARLDFTDTLRNAPALRTVFLEFNARTVTETAGLPDILLDNSVLSTRIMEGYNYARYTRNRLVTESGSFPYFADFESWEPIFGERKKVDFEGFTHYLQKNDNEDVLVISRKTDGLRDYINRFSWWFLAALLLLAIEQFFSAGGLNSFFGKKAGFKQKIQVMVVFTVSAFFIVMVRGSLIFLIKQYDQQNRRLLSEKMYAVTLNLEETMGGRLSRITGQREYLEYKLSELGNLFGTDINVYGTDGMLLAGSRPELFIQGFLSERMNPDAFQTLQVKQLTELIRDEHIGKLSYISAYSPLIDEDGKISGYLNIPYFAKQKEINQEITASANALVNIFITALTLLLTLVLLFTNRITEPLRELGKKMGELRYGSKTAKIEYQGEDEIGNLVKEYNRLSEELERSATLLAEKERESAWREMAKQVAHEIKNPLTPMKLNVEFLERAWKDQSPDFPERISRFKSMMIEQIDTLSRIADEFSNFAKLPPARKEVTDLREILDGVAGLYAENEKNVEVIFHRPDEPLPVFADKEHLLRVFNNLVKNAIQSIPEGRKGKVEIFGFTDGKNNTILVKDNGSGIPDYLRDRIFTPNFTTKSSGSGLGLAISRSIVRECGGDIDFVTYSGEGSTFRTILPRS